MSNSCIFYKTFILLFFSFFIFACSIEDNDSIATVVDSNANGLIDLVTQEQLQNIRYNLAGTSYKIDDSDASVNCNGNICRGYELLANIALSTNWQPIGSDNNLFTSILQGNGYSIANLVIDGGNYLGLFAVLAGATIDNLVVEVASISGDSYVGALAGIAVNSHFTNVEIRAASTSSKLSATGIGIGGMLGAIIDTTIINATSDLSIVAAGSIVGGLVGLVASSDISRSSASGSVSSNGDENIVYGGLVGWVASSDISHSSASGSVSSNGDENIFYGGLVGGIEKTQISHSSASGSVSSNGDENIFYGGLVGGIEKTQISHSSASGSVSSNGDENIFYGGLVGWVASSDISRSSASGSVSSNGDENIFYGGLVGAMEKAQISYSGASGSVSSSGVSSDAYGGLVGAMEKAQISYSGASGSVSSSGVSSDAYGGLVGYMSTSSDLSHSSASGSVSSNGANSDQYGGLVGVIFENSKISYSSASGSVTSSGANSDAYGGLVGESSGDIRHSWSSSSVFASNSAGLVGNNEGNLEFSYALGVVLQNTAPVTSGFGLVATNRDTITNSYWNSETSGALVAADVTYNTINIDSSDTVGMLAATGSATSRIFKGFAAATDELGNNIWTFASGNYPVVTELGLDKQAVALAYGLLRLANPNVGGSTLDSFLGSTLNHEAIALDANSYNANEPLAILDVNLLASDNGCSTENNGNSLVSNSANSTKVKLTVNLAKTSDNLQERVVYTGSNCSIDFNSATSISAGDRLQLAATITKGSASLTKNFIINFR